MAKEDLPLALREFQHPVLLSPGGRIRKSGSKAPFSRTRTALNHREGWMFLQTRDLREALGRPEAGAVWLGSGGVINRSRMLLP